MGVEGAALRRDARGAWTPCLILKYGLIWVVCPVASPYLLVPPPSLLECGVWCGGGCGGVLSAGGKECQPAGTEECQDTHCGCAVLGRRNIGHLCEANTICLCVDLHLTCAPPCTLCRYTSLWPSCRTHQKTTVQCIRSWSPYL